MICYVLGVFLMENNGIIYNYKTAIGEPLTLMLKNFLLSKVKEPDSVSMFEKVLTPELVEILKDDTAYENFRGILGGESND